MYKHSISYYKDYSLDISNINQQTSINKHQSTNINQQTSIIKYTYTYIYEFCL